MNAIFHATIEDLYQVESKAEIIKGEIVHFMPTGGIPIGRAIGFAVA